MSTVTARVVQPAITNPVHAPSLLLVPCGTHRRSKSVPASSFGVQIHVDWFGCVNIGSTAYVLGKRRTNDNQLPLRTWHRNAKNRMSRQPDCNCYASKIVLQLRDARHKTKEETRSQQTSTPMYESCLDFTQLRVNEPNANRTKNKRQRRCHHLS